MGVVGWNPTLSLLCGARSGSRRRCGEGSSGAREDRMGSAPGIGGVVVGRIAHPTVLGRGWTQAKIALPEADVRT